ncbi:MAG: hypothetical protein PHF00_06675 [Elusimicrobia bacterium]|nr:hypothetical protein [Elusimicrobiota bacterium]
MGNSIPRKIGLTTILLAAFITATAGSRVIAGTSIAPAATSGHARPSISPAPMALANLQKLMNILGDKTFSAQMISGYDKTAERMLALGTLTEHLPEAFSSRAIDAELAQKVERACKDAAGDVQKAVESRRAEIAAAHKAGLIDDAGLKAATVELEAFAFYGETVKRHIKAVQKMARLARLFPHLRNRMDEIARRLMDGKNSEMLGQDAQAAPMSDDLARGAEPGYVESLVKAIAASRDGYEINPADARIPAVRAALEKASRRGVKIHIGKAQPQSGTKVPAPSREIAKGMGTFIGGILAAGTTATALFELSHQLLDALLAVSPWLFAIGLSAVAVTATIGFLGGVIAGVFGMVRILQVLINRLAKLDEPAKVLLGVFGGIATIEGTISFMSSIVHPVVGWTVAIGSPWLFYLAVMALAFLTFFGILTGIGLLSVAWNARRSPELK